MIGIIAAFAHNRVIGNNGIIPTEYFGRTDAVFVN